MRASSWSPPKVVPTTIRAWFRNLRADPSFGVQVGGRRFTAHARVASPAEREIPQD
ncbi:nitroreductase/quinone reductase family protein [Streptomyces sp. NPDC001107]